MSAELINRIAITLLVTLLSCDCFVHEKGIVKDSRTGKPLTKVTVTYDKKQYETDDNGNFTIEFATGFCPDRHFIIEKDSFNTFDLLIDSDGDIMKYSVKNKSDYSTFDKPQILDSTSNSFITGEWVDQNSKNFTVRNDTIIIYLDKQIIEQ